MSSQGVSPARRQGQYTLDCSLLQERSLVLTAGLESETITPACLLSAGKIRKHTEIAAYMYFATIIVYIWLYSCLIL